MAYKKGRDHLIWTDNPYYMDYEDWKESVDDVLEEYDNEEPSDEERWDIVDEINNTFLEDERANLNVNVGSTIYAIADVGRWDGRADGYKEIKSGNLSDCLYANVNGMSYCTWYVTPDGEFCLDESHHDGTNYVVYRAERTDLTDEEYDNLRYEAITNEQLWDYTRPLGPDVGKVYGWTFNVSSSSRLRRNDKIEAADDQIDTVSIDFDIDTIRENLRKGTERSAWSRGVRQYANELLDELAEHIEGGYENPANWKSYKDFEKALLNGARDWNQYSWGGSGLIYDGDIAERLCSPSELKKTRNGERRPNSREEWLDVQARALYQAYRALLRAGVYDYIDQNKKRG